MAWSVLVSAIAFNQQLQWQVPSALGTEGFEVPKKLFTSLLVSPCASTLQISFSLNSFFDCLPNVWMLSVNQTEVTRPSSWHCCRVKRGSKSKLAICPTHSATGMNSSKDFLLWQLNLEIETSISASFRENPAMWSVVSSREGFEVRSCRTASVNIVLRPRTLSHTTDMHWSTWSIAEAWFSSHSFLTKARFAM